MRRINFRTINILFVHFTMATSLIYSILNFEGLNSFFSNKKEKEKEKTVKITSSTSSQWANDSLDCHVYQIQQGSSDFVPVLQCQWNHPGIATYAPPMFADVDGDGKTEIVALLEHSPDGFAIIDPETCEAEHIIAVHEEIWLKDGGIALGDVDHNGIADIFIPAGTRLQRWAYNPITMQVEKIWETDYNVTPGERAHLDILDINQDGIPEIIPNIGQMVNAVTGEVYPGVLPSLHAQGKGLFGFTADALPEPSPPGQSEVELLYGTSIYRYDFNALAWIEVKRLPSYSWGSDACVAIADMDLDGDIDAVITNYLESGPGEALIWDLQTDELLGREDSWNYPSWKGSRMMIANMDDDPYPEMAMTSRYTMFAVDDIVTSGGFGNIVWLDVTTDESGHTELTSFDFNGDGKYEIAYRDETHLRIFSGMGNGIPTGHYPSGAEVLLNSDQLFNSCGSFTGMEYPTIGDVDNDDEAEMVTTCRDLINVFKSGSLPWRDATQVWNTNAFNVTCVNQDGTIPADPVENYTKYNNFLSQVTLAGNADSVAIAIPDAYIHIVNAENQCGEDLLIEMNICNQGEAAMPTGTPIAVYVGDPRIEATLIHTLSLTADLEAGNCVPRTIQREGLESSNLHIFAVVNDDGTHSLPYILDDLESGGDFSVTGITECDYTNNISDSLFIYEYSEESTLEAVICENDTFFVAQSAYTEAGIYQTVLQAANGCDSLVTLTLEVLERGISQQSAEICNGERYEFANQFYQLSGTYYDTIPLPDGCDSLVRLDLTILADIESVTAATICEGQIYEFNGQNYTETGWYRDTLINIGANGCDSIVALNLSIVPPVTTHMNVNVCEGESYIFADTARTESGTYSQLLTSYHGCDSLVTLNLDILPSIEATVSTTICHGEVYWFNNQTYHESGMYQEQFTNALGCDSIVTLDLTVLPVYDEVVDATICRGSSYSFGGYEYAEQGSFMKYLTSQDGCDSIVTLNLYLENPAYEEDHITLCEGESHLFGNMMLNEVGVYHDTFTMASGCDSFVWMHIYMIPSFEDSFERTICGGETYAWNDSTYHTSGIYQQVFPATNGCDSTVTLDLQVIPTQESSMTVNICEGESYEAHGTLYQTSGIYMDTLSTTMGCDSVTALHLFVLPKQEIHLDESICEGESYQVGNSTYTTSGLYTHTLTADNGCDSIVELRLSVLPKYDTPLTHTMCEGEIYQFENNVLNETGFYTETLTASNGCDSVLNLDLQVLPIVRREMSVSLCDGESITIGQNTYSETGFYENTFTGFNGCDSTVALNLSVYPTYEITSSTNICEGESYVFGSTMLTEGGFYTENFTSLNGCDSVVNLQLFVLPNTSYFEEKTICDGESIQIGDFTYSEPGDYSHTLQSIIGCDSVVNIVLSVLPEYDIQLEESICEGENYLFNNQNLNNTGTYEAALTSSNGCDSLVTLDLNVLPNIQIPISATICDGESYEFGGNQLTTSGIHAQTYNALNGCDSTIILDLIVLPTSEEVVYATICDGETYAIADTILTDSGNYRFIENSDAGCDSTITLQLFVLPNPETHQTQTICEGESIQIGVFTYTETGSYTHTLESTAGCDSLVSIDLLVLTHTEINMEMEICEGESYIFNNQELLNSGVYEASYTSSNGCDSLVTLDLNVLENKATYFEARICQGETYEFAGQQVNSPDVYQEVYTAYNGCDSTVTLDLKVLPNAESYLIEVICEGESYTVGDDVYTTSGIYTQTLETAISNCDSVIVLELIVLPKLMSSLNETICEGSSIQVGNNTYTESGTYWNTLTSSIGCDSVVQLNLEVLPVVTITKEETICAGETLILGDKSYTNSGTYTQTFATENGCDSTIILNLDVLPANISVISAEICTGSSYGSYTETGIYYDTLQNAAFNGCDSIIVLTLEVLEHINFEYSEVLCHGETYDFNGQILTEDGIYQANVSANNGCDSTVTLDLKILPEIQEIYEYEMCDGDSLFIAGAYRFAADIFIEELTNINGCDSLVETTLLVEPWIDISAYGGEICVGDSIQVGVTGADNYEWTPTEGLSCSTCPNPIASPETTTIYTVRSRGCLDNIVETEVEVLVHSSPILALNENINIPIGQSVDLKAEIQDESEILEIYWTAEEKRFCTGCFEVTVTPPYTVTYTVHITDIYGCVSQQAVTVTVREECIDDDFNIPNMMTPNGDGFNDEFYIQTEIPVNLKWVRIYNRWGQLLFESRSLDDRWDGTYRNTPLNPGVYAYYLELICPNGEPYKKVGNITIVK